jgi:hypothetical protein
MEVPQGTLTFLIDAAATIRGVGGRARPQLCHTNVVQHAGPRTAGIRGSRRAALRR